MMNSSKRWAGWRTVAIVFAVACVDGAAAVPARASGNNPVPQIVALTPVSTPPGVVPAPFTVYGTGFVTKSVVNWNGAALATTYNAGRKNLTATVPAADVAAASTASITVTNPGPGGGTSSAVYFPVTAQSTFTFNRNDLGAANGIPAGPRSVIAADFNGDGIVDLAIACDGGGKGKGVVAILLGNGDGTFKMPVAYATDSFPYQVAVGDFNGDGKLDLVTANEAGSLSGSPNQGSPATISLLLGNGDGTFQPQIKFQTGSVPFSIATGDFNQDGHWDVVTADQTGNSGISLLAGTGVGPGYFQPSQGFGICPQGETAGTSCMFPNLVVNGNFFKLGIPDLGVLNWNGGYGDISLLQGGGSALLKCPSGKSQQFCPNVLICTGTSAATNSVQTTGCVSDQIISMNPPGQATAAMSADFNHDGTSDLVWASSGLGAGNPPPGAVFALEGLGGGSLEVPSNCKPNCSYPTAAFPNALSAGDFDGDGNLDLAVAAGNFAGAGPGTGDVSILLGNGDGTFQPRMDFATGAFSSSLAVADFNNDGRLDIAVTNYGAGTVSLLSQVPGSSVSLFPTGLGFGNQTVGTSSAPLTITIANTGAAFLTLTSIVTSGANEADFSDVHNCSAGLAAGSSCAISVVFAPHATGTRRASLVITDSDAKSPQTISLSGSGK